jgi:diguanylate cyclase (GGDEF)-like protein
MNKKSKIGFFGKQLIAALSINIVSLLLISILLYTNFINDYKSNMIAMVDSKIQLLADSSSSALIFYDENSASEILQTLKLNPSIRYAQIYDRDKQLFAEYKPQGQIIDKMLDEFHHSDFFEGANLYSFRQITKDDELLGTILLSANTDALSVQKKSYITTAVIVLLCSFLIACIFTWKLHRKLSVPFTDLINLVNYVATYKLYHKRLENSLGDEIGELVLGVNAMLDTIQKTELLLYNRANYDELTKLPNRHLLMERLSQAIKNADRNKTQIAVLFLDLDRFKIINDSLGHIVGDQLLVQVTEKVLSSIRVSDTVCRWGGDEFVVLLDNIQLHEDIQSVVDKISNVLNSENIIGNNSLFVSTSVGIACYPKDGENANDLLKHADASMYEAKSEGPGNFRYFDSHMLDGAETRLSMESKVRQAFERDEFFLMYQPQLSADTKILVGFEALIRWEYEGKMIPPDVFLPIVEDIGLMYELSLWVLRQACKQNSNWQEAGLKPVSVAVNLPASFILRPQSNERILEILTFTGLAPEHLEIELTEHTFLDSREGAVSVLNQLVDLGIAISLDDFGTGYSCLAYLQYIPVAKLKIDGVFIRELGLNEASDAIVQSIITLGKGLGMKLVAECVETEQQLSILKNMDCDVIQGYLFSKPLSTDEATLFLRKSAGLQRSDLVIIK